MPNITKKAEAITDKETVPLKALATEHSGALTPQDSVKTAGERMREVESPTWPVVEDHKLVGTVDEENPDWKMGGQGHDPECWQVGSIMNRELIYCYEDEDCTKAEQLMEERGLTYLPVVDRQLRIVGIFSRGEIKQRAHSTAKHEV